MENALVKSPIVDRFGNPMVSKASAPNFDTKFFFPTTAGDSITSEDIDRRPYQYHTWTFACVWAYAKNISSLPLYLHERGDKTKVVEDRWGILNLFHNPNPFQTYTPFIQFCLQFLLLPIDYGVGRRGNRSKATGGQTFLVMKKAINGAGAHVDLSKGEIPDIILPFSSKFFDPVVSGDGMQHLVGWKFEVPGKVKTRDVFAPHEIIRIYQANPYDPLAGLSNYVPAQIAILQDIKADLYNTKLYDNSAIPAGLLTTEQLLQQSDKDMYMKMWYQEFGGAGNNNKVGMMGKGLKYENIGITPADMQFTEMKESVFDRILADYGLNKIALGRYEKINFATIKEGRRMLWHDSYWPMAKLITEAINSKWIRFVDPRIELSFDISDVEALRPDYTKRSKAAGEMVTKMGFPASLAARLNDIPLTKEDLIRWPFLDDKPVKVSSEINPDKKEDTDKAFTSPENRNYKEFVKDYYVRLISPGEKRFKEKMIRFFNAQRNRMQDLVDEWLKVQNTNNSISKLLTKTSKGLTVNADMFIPEIAEENKKLLKLVRPLVKEQLEATEAKLEEELGELIEWNVTDETIDKFVAKRRAEMKKINTTTFRKAREEIGDVIKEGVKENWTAQQMAKEIKSSIGLVANQRKNAALTIARTETGIISNTARFEAFEAEGIEYHEWLTAGDSEVRELHAETNNKVVRVGTTFTPVSLKFPQDTESSASTAENIINCRCIAIASRPPQN